MNWIGVWLSADPLGEASGINLYAYVLGDPINGWDPYGLEFWTWGDSDSDDWFPSAGEMGENMANGVAGLGDALSFGASKELRKALGTDHLIDKCSKSYAGGEVASFAFGGAGAGRMAYMGSAKLIARGAPATMNVARGAVAQRNTLKGVFRLGLFPNARKPNFGKIAEKYGNDAAEIIAASRRTNTPLNQMGAAAAATGLGGTAVNHATNGDCP